MQIVTVNLPSSYIDAIAAIVAEGGVDSRSEWIRQAIREFLAKELVAVEMLLGLDERETRSYRVDGKETKTPTKIDMRTIRTGWKK